MAKIDIRFDSVEKVDKIVFADEKHECTSIRDCGNKHIEFKDSLDEFVLVAAEDIPNLIKALQKAIELGWTK